MSCVETGQDYYAASWQGAWSEGDQGWSYDLEWDYQATLRPVTSGEHAGWADGCRPESIQVEVYIGAVGGSGFDAADLEIVAYSPVDDAYEVVGSYELDPLENAAWHTLLIPLDWDGVAEHYSFDGFDFTSYLYSPTPTLILRLQAGEGEPWWTAYHHSEETL